MGSVVEHLPNNPKGLNLMPSTENNNREVTYWLSSGISGPQESGSQTAKTKPNQILISLLGMPRVKTE